MSLCGVGLVRVWAEGAVLSKSTGQNREESTACAAWVSERENKKNVKSNFEVILPLILQH